MNYACNHYCSGRTYFNGPHFYQYTSYSYMTPYGPYYVSTSFYSGHGGHSYSCNGGVCYSQQHRQHLKQKNVERKIAGLKKKQQEELAKFKEMQQQKFAEFEQKQKKQVEEFRKAQQKELSQFKLNQQKQLQAKRTMLAQKKKK